jgi:hypothetical protein
MKHRIITSLFILSILFVFTTAQNKETMQSTSREDDLKCDSGQNKIKFEYQIVAKPCEDAYFDIKNTHLLKNTHTVLKDTVSVQFCADGLACNRVCSLDKHNDSLVIRCACAKNSEKQFEICYCMFCKIIGLTKGIYYLNYYGSDGHKKIEIK